MELCKRDLPDVHVEPLDRQLPLRVRHGEAVARHLHDHADVLARERRGRDDRISRARQRRCRLAVGGDGRGGLPVRLELPSELELRTLERLDDVDLERDVANDLEMRIEEGDDVRALTLQVREGRRQRDSLADDLGAKGREKVELERERIERVHLEGKDLALVAEGEDDGVGDRDRVGLGRHDELERRMLAPSSCVAEADGGREGGTRRVGMAQRDVDKRLLVEVVVSVWQSQHARMSLVETHRYGRE